MIWLGHGTGVPSPHGGKLITRVLAGSALERAQEEIKEIMSVTVGREVASDIENIADGVFSPIEGFMLRNDFNNVVKSGRLANGTPWTIPIVLDVDEQTAKAMKDSHDVAIKDQDGNAFAIVHVEDTYKFHRKEMALAVYGTNDTKHPGVMRTMNMHDILVGGNIDLISRPHVNEVRTHKLLPVVTRDEFRSRGWKTVVGFQTRNIPHIAHEMLQRLALNIFDGLFINPLVGKKKAGDFKDEVLIRSYEILIENYFPQNNVLFSTLHTEMRYAGPKEAILHAIMRKNFGCSHFIVGRDHAGVGNYYHPFAAQAIFKDFPDLGIEPVFFPAFFYCKKCMLMVSEKTCPHPVEWRMELSGTKLRQMVANGERPPELLIRPEITEVILNWKDPFIA